MAASPGAGVGSTASAAAWMFKLAVLGSTAYVGLQLLPILDSTPAGHAVALVYSQEELLAAAGVRRVGRHARRSDTSRRKVVAAGAVEALGHAAGRGNMRLRDAVVDAVREVVLDEEAAVQVVRNDALMNVLCDDTSDKASAAEVWRRVARYEEGCKVVRERGVCARCGEKGREVLRKAGAC